MGKVTLILNIAFKIGSLMILGGFQAIFHGICPGINRTSASDKIKKLYNHVNGRDS